MAGRRRREQPCRIDNDRHGQGLPVGGGQAEPDVTFHDDARRVLADLEGQLGQERVDALHGLLEELDLVPGTAGSAPPRPRARTR